MASKTDILQTREVLLRKLPVRVEYLMDDRIGLHTRSATELEAFKSEVLDGMVYRLTSTVLAEQVVDKTVSKTHTFEHKVVFPRSWWQHFKRDALAKLWLTRWFVNWKPVKYETDYKRETMTLTANFKQYAKFPSADLVLTPESIHHGLVVWHEEVSYS